VKQNATVSKFYTLGSVEVRRALPRANTPTGSRLKRAHVRYQLRDPPWVPLKNADRAKLSPMSGPCTMVPLPRLTVQHTLQLTD